MSYEVELKFPVTDLLAITAKLLGMGVDIKAEAAESDVYFAHPARDFAKTDEAIRLRRKGEANLITYKGPKIDSASKTRREIELPLASGEASHASWTLMLEALGFKPVAEVRKRRRKANVPWQGREVEASLDTVDELGQFVELELIAEEGQVDEARATITALAESLGLKSNERRSYLELLLERGSRGEAPRSTGP